MSTVDLEILRGRRVLVTGHTGFKGGWLTTWLATLGAEVTGYALAPDTEPCLFAAARVGERCRSIEGDVRDRPKLEALVEALAPEVVFHLAAQPLVRRSYAEPHETLEVNVMGTVNLLEALRKARTRAAVVVVTSDKCYENREWVHGYREPDALGGHDVYSASKAACEIATQSYRRSFFAPERLAEHGVALATARAGNVIGGGDWAEARLVPDAVRALAAGDPFVVRNPRSVRPWQHVLEPLGGYLALAARLLGPDAAQHSKAYNFGPAAGDACDVATLADRLVVAWGEGRWIDGSNASAPHEAGVLRLAIDLAVAELGFRPRWPLEETVRRTVAWYRAFYAGADVAALTAAQIEAYGLDAARSVG
ncbi:MAG: CDP-glucose 4,6-dehydratase [Myxococcales bacterium]|nr:CDP-glucose 4,6-dehydratase [Myxococcales bacterium]